jgi:hypothetical protein
MFETGGRQYRRRPLEDWTTKWFARIVVAVLVTAGLLLGIGLLEPECAGGELK